MKTPIKYWTTLPDVNYHAAVLFLIEQPLLEILLEIEEEHVSASNA